jgi:hypothetical protein
MKKALFIAVLLLAVGHPVSFAQIIPPSLNTTNNTLTPSQVTNACVDALQQYFGVQSHKSISVHGTEYARGIDTQGKIFIQIIQGNSTINNASCDTTAYYPNNSLFINAQDMDFLAKGIYYHDFSIVEDQPLGVYPTVVDCTFPTQTVVAIANNFSVSQGTTTGTLNNTFFQDGTFLRVQETNLLARHFDVIYNFSVANFTDENTTEMSVSTYAEWNGAGAGETVQVFIFNFTSGEWLELPNNIPDVNDFVSVSNSLSGNLSDFHNGSQVMVRFNDSASTVDGANSNFDADRINIIINNNFPTPIEHLQGSGELHITGGLYMINSTVKNLSDIEILHLSEINQTTRRNEYNLSFIISNMTQALFLLDQINDTTFSTSLLLQTVNFTVTANNVLLQAINNTVTATSLYLNSFVSQSLNSTYSAVQEVNQTTRRNEQNISFVLNLAQNINLTAQQILSLAQYMNLTEQQTYQLLQEMNMTLNNVNATVTQFNFTQNITFAPLINVTLVDNSTHPVNFTFVDNSTHVVNLTLNQTLVANVTVNFTELNATSQAILTYVQNINSTVNDIDATTFATALMVQLIYDKVFDINLTVFQMNSTLNALSSYVNGFVSGSLNSTYTLLSSMNVTLNNINTTVSNLNFSQNITVNNTITVSANVTVNATAAINVTDFVNELLNAQITETIL